MTERMRTMRTKAALPVVAVLILAAIIMSLLTGSALAVDRWSDISDQQWVDTYGVTAAEVATVAEGYPDGTFRPANPVTRAQFAKMVVDGFDLLPTTVGPPTFSDVPMNHFYFEWIEGAADAGVVNGYSDGTFKPERSIQRQEANTILGRWLSDQELDVTGHIQGASGTYASLQAWYAAEGGAVLMPFADEESVGTPHTATTAYLVMRGVVEGVPLGGLTYLRPLQNLTRAQAAVMILRVEEAADFDAPRLTDLEPDFGPVAGGNEVVISGTGLVGAASVTFGTTVVTDIDVNTAGTEITVVAPAHAPGAVQVTVQIDGVTTNALTYTYMAAVAKIVIETEADGTGQAVGDVELAAGESLTVYAVAYDAEDDLIGNVAVDWSLINKTGGVVDADLVAAADERSATFTAGLVGGAVIEAELGMLTDVTGTISVVAGDVADLLLVAPAEAEAGVGFAVTVSAVDAEGNVLTDYTGTVVFASTDPDADLPPNYTFVAGDMGTRTFPGVMLESAGARTITVADLAMPTMSGTDTVTVVAAPAEAFVVQAPAIGVAMTPLQFTVTAVDEFGNVDTDYAGTVEFSSTDAGATLPADYTFVAADAGTRTFAVTFSAAGDWTIVATDTTDNTITGTDTVNVAAAS